MYVLAEYVRDDGVKERVVKQLDGVFEGHVCIEIETQAGDWQLKRRLGKELKLSLLERVQTN